MDLLSDGYSSDESSAVSVVGSLKDQDFNASMRIRKLETDGETQKIL